MSSFKMQEAIAAERAARDRHLLERVTRWWNGRVAEGCQISTPRIALAELYDYKFDPKANTQTQWYYKVRKQVVRADFLEWAGEAVSEKAFARCFKELLGEKVRSKGEKGSLYEGKSLRVRKNTQYWRFEPLYVFINDYKTRTRSEFDAEELPMVDGEGNLL